MFANMNDKTIKEKHRQSLDPSRFAFPVHKNETFQNKLFLENNKRNITISENQLKQKIIRTSMRNKVEPAENKESKLENQINDKKSQKVNECANRNSGIKSYLSEKQIRIKPAETFENPTNLKNEHLDKNTKQKFSGHHFLNPNYKNIDFSKHEQAIRLDVKNQWNKSNLSIQKKDGSINKPKNSKTNSLIMSVLTKNQNSGKLKNFFVDDSNPNLIETKNKKHCAKLGSAIILPIDLNLPNSPIKNKNLFINQHTLNKILHKNCNPEKIIQESNFNKEINFEPLSPASLIINEQNSPKNVSFEKPNQKEQNYFFNLKSIQKLNLKDKSKGISHVSGLKSSTSNNNSSNDIPGKLANKIGILDLKFAKNQKLEVSCKKNIEKRNNSNKIHPGIQEQFPSLFTQRLSTLGIKKEPIVPKFQQILQNISIENETEDLKIIKQLIKVEASKGGKIPETDLSFYDIVKRIGEGSFGKVYLGLQKLTNRLVAIKRLEKINCKDEITRKKILSEVNIQKTMFGHPNIIKLYEVFENKQHVYFVMEYAANGDLLKLLKTKKHFEEEDARGIFFQISSGLRYIHHKGIIHRDIKLDNILIDESFHYKICDFGVGRYMKQHELINEQCGTPAYLAPEIVLEKGYKGFGADIWSLGILLFCLLTGNMPFKASTLEKLNQLIVQGEFEYPKDLELSDDVKDLIAKMLTVDPEKRITIEAVLEHDWVKSVNMNRATFQNINQFEQNHFKYLSNFEEKVFDSAVVAVAEFGFSKESVLNSIHQKQMNHATACYFTIERDFI